MRRVVGILYDAGGSANTALMVNLQQEGERRTSDLASCLHSPVQMIIRTLTEPGSGTVGFSAFSGASVEGDDSWNWETGLLKSPEGTEPLLCFFNDGQGVNGQVVHYFHSYELVVTDPLHSSAINSQLRMMLPAVPPDVSHHLLCFVDV